MTFTINAVKAEMDFMKRIFTPAKLQSIDKNQEVAKELKNQNQLMRLQMNNLTPLTELYKMEDKIK